MAVAILCPIVPNTAPFIAIPSYAPTVETPCFIGPHNCEQCTVILPEALRKRCSTTELGRRGRALLPRLHETVKFSAHRSGARERRVEGREVDDDAGRSAAAPLVRARAPRRWSSLRLALSELPRDVFRDEPASKTLGSRGWVRARLHLEAAARGDLKGICTSVYPAKRKRR